MKFCTNCGQEHKDNAKFCCKCGYPLEDSMQETKPIIEEPEHKETSSSANDNTNDDGSKFNWKELNPFIYTYKVYPIGWITLVNLLLGLLKSFALLGIYCSPIFIESDGVEAFLTCLICCGAFFLILRQNKDKWTDKLAGE